MNITASKEDYLKAILHLKEKNGYVRATDVAEVLSVKKPSVSIAFGKLAADHSPREPPGGPDKSRV